jgi:hypothetical protein
MMQSTQQNDNNLLEFWQTAQNLLQIPNQQWLILRTERESGFISAIKVGCLMIQ